MSQFSVTLDLRANESDGGTLCMAEPCGAALRLLYCGNPLQLQRVQWLKQWNFHNSVLVSHIHVYRNFRTRVFKTGTGSGQGDTTSEQAPDGVPSELPQAGM
jgi:hypothetical protein